VLTIDPLVAHLPEKIDSHRDQSVRRALAPLYRLAKNTGCAVVAVLHLNKSIGADPLMRLPGSVGFGNAVRSVLLLQRDPDDPDGERGHRRVLAHTKHNLGPLAPSLLYRLVPIVLPAVDNAPMVETSRLELIGESEHDGRALLSVGDDEERSAREEAVDFLRDYLADGTRHSVSEIYKEASSLRISDRTLRDDRVARRMPRLTQLAHRRNIELNSTASRAGREGGSLMSRRMLQHLRRNLVAYLALFAALTSSGYAATTKLLPANSVGTRQVINHSLLKKDFKAGQLPRGAQGPMGPAGATGSTGATGPRGAAVVARARSLNSVAAGEYPGTDDPLTANTWTQGPNETDLFVGRMTYQVGPTCTVGGTTPQLLVNLFLNGSFVGSLRISQPVSPGATQTFDGVAYAFEPGASTAATLTAKVWDPCQAHFTVSDLSIDVVALA
jgi:hypothetical protein